MYVPDVNKLSNVMLSDRPMLAVQCDRVDHAVAIGFVKIAWAFSCSRLVKALVMLLENWLFAAQCNELIQLALACSEREAWASHCVMVDQPMLID